MFSNPNRGKLAASVVQRSSQRQLRAATRRPAPWPNAAIMDEEFEFHFNIYDESNVNRPRAERPHGDNAMCWGVDRRRTCDEDAHGLLRRQYARMI
jgi:hypothetical protein